MDEKLNRCAARLRAVGLQMEDESARLASACSGGGPPAALPLAMDRYLRSAVRETVSLSLAVGLLGRAVC